MRLMAFDCRLRRTYRTAAAVCLLLAHAAAWAQTRGTDPGEHRMRARRFLAGRTKLAGEAGAAAIDTARQQHATLLAAQQAGSSLSASWQAVGPAQIASIRYGTVTGRVTSIAVDPADTTGNTVYVGSTGGGVWRSGNAAGASGSVSFQPLTDTLSVFSANAGTTAIPSLSIGALSVQNGVLLAGTGDPNDATDSYYGSGILRSADGGLTWTLAQRSTEAVADNHNFFGLSVAGFAWSTTTPSLVVAALTDSLEGDLAGATSQQSSVRGLYYSTDAGVTWQMSTIMDGGQPVQQPLTGGANGAGNAVTAVVWNPVRKLFFAAVRYHGYYQSADGVTWTRLTQQPATTLSLTACPTDPTGTGDTHCPIFRGALAVQPVTGDTFALTVDSNNLDQGLWRDVCALSGSACGNAVAFGTRLPSASLEVGGGNTAIDHADYAMTLAAVPAGIGTGNPDTLLFAGTTDLYRCSLATGCSSLRNTTNAINACNGTSLVAPYQHALATLSSASLSLVYLGNDGGLWRSTDDVNQAGTPCSADDATHFQNLNHGLGSLAEVLSFAQDPADANTLLAGLGANGATATGAAASTAAWPQLTASEGGTVAIDPAAPLNWYVATAAGVSIGQCGSGSACTAASFAGPPTIGLAQVSDDSSLVDPPWLLDPELTSDLLLGTCRVWRGPAASGAAWSSANAISEPFGGAQNAVCTTNPAIRSLAAGGAASGVTAAQDAGSTVLYAGMAGALDGGGNLGGHVFANIAGGSAANSTVWTDVALSTVTNDAGNAGRFNPGSFDLSSLTADPHDATGKTVYATVMGFGVPHLYRSTSGGASWIDISSNLPGAPANSVVVDPNDANTVYVALDTGVYVTSAVTTCTATANCWDVYGLGLPNAPVVQLAVAAAMPTGDGRTGELRAATYGRGIWQLPLLTALSASAPAMTLSPASLTFAAQQQGTASAAQTITVTNTGSSSLIVSMITTGGDFNQTNTCTGASIAPNAACTVQVVYLPTATGTRNGVLTVYGNVPGGQATAALTGMATPPSNIVLTPIALSFPSTSVGATATAENITISNTGGATATLQTPVVSGADFKLSANTCGATLGPSTGCTVAIAFAPTASGTRTGTLTVTDSVGTQTSSLTGIATAPATDALSPLSLGFAAQQIGGISAAQTVTLTNTGDVALTLIAAQILQGDFSVLNGCGTSLSAHSSCQLVVTYVPKNVGAETGTLRIADQYRSQTVTLSGTGLAPPGVSLAPFGGLSFAATGVGIASVAQTVTLTNNNPQPLTLTNLGLTGDFAVIPGSNTCGSGLAANSACTLQVAFVPTAAGPRSGVLTITDPSAVHTLALTGVGVDFTLTASNSSVSVASGKPAVYGLLLISTSGVPGNATFTCSGAPANTTCLVIPGSVALGTGTVTVTVTVATGVASAALSPGAGSPAKLLWAAVFAPFALLGLRRRVMRGRLVCLLVLVGLIAATGCGSGRLIPATSVTAPTTPTTPTPSGSSTIVVSATSAGLVRTVDLTLTVQ